MLSTEDRLSPLYSRYNGALFGIFYSMSVAGFAKAGFRNKRLRMLQFLGELQIKEPVSIPTTHRAFSAQFQQIFLAITRMFALAGPEYKEMFQSFVVARLFMAKGFRSYLPEGADHMTAQFLDDLNVRLADFNQLWERVPDIQKEETISVDYLMESALEFVRKLIDPLKEEGRTCFISMPFRKPFEEYYDILYRPLLEKHDYRTFRTWGGFNSEVYLPLMLTMINKCGCLLADISGWNPNVTFELGYAYGKNKLCIQLANEKDYKNPGNLKGTGTIAYNPDEPGWPDSFVDGWLATEAIKGFKQIYNKDKQSLRVSLKD